jgi:hypothetical protein
LGIIERALACAGTRCECTAPEYQHPIWSKIGTGVASTKNPARWGSRGGANQESALSHRALAKGYHGFANKEYRQFAAVRLFSLAFKFCNPAGVLPKLYVVTVNHSLGAFLRTFVIVANEIDGLNEITVAANQVCSITRA